MATPRSARPLGTSCERPDLAAQLPVWDQLPAGERRAVETHAAACPSCGAGLALLLEADSWLAQGPGASCPPSGELYDFANGPGAVPLVGATRERIERHVEGCGACSELVATLAGRPPAPLILDAAPEPTAAAAPKPTPSPAGAPRVAPERTPRGPRALPRLALLLAGAAGILLAFRLLGDRDLGASHAAAADFPEWPVTRGAEDGALAFPREAVLAAAGGGLAHPLLFEVDPLEGASVYRLRVYRRGVDTFAGEEQVLELSATEVPIELPAELAAELAPGRYTWELWALVDGLTTPMGRRDFEVRLDPACSDELARLAELDAGERGRRGLELLLERGYPGDARAWARALPASPERDAWLATRPGR